MQESSAQAARRSYGKIIRLAAVLVSLLVTAALLEGGLRLAGYSPASVNPLRAFHEFDPVVGWRGKRGGSGRFKRPEFDVLIQHDANGFRRQVHLGSKDETAPHHVFVLGDSYVWGWGVAEGEVFTDKMNVLMKDHAVLNHGINGVGTVAEWLLFEAEVKDRLRAGDTVLLLFCKNDFADNVERRRVHAEVRDGAVRIVNAGKPLTSPLEDWLATHSHLYSFLAYRADLFKLTRARNREQDESLGEAMGETDPRRIITGHFLGQFEAECKARRAVFIVAYIPSQGELGETRAARPNRLANDQACRSTLFSITDSLGLGTVDLLGPFLEFKRKTGQNLTFEQDQHWNATGHRVAAEVLAARLLQPPPNRGRQP
jgi:hypothetical protein